MPQRIDFTIIGAQKAGTTSLYEYLSQHRDIYLPYEKENLFFSEDELFRRGDAYLRHYYRRYAEEKVCGHAYVHLLFLPDTAERMWRYNPAMKLIAVLRNPIDRAYSGYWQARRTSHEPCATFEEALAQEPERLNGSRTERISLTHRTHGEYHDQLQPFLARFPRGQLKIVLFDDLAERTRETVSDVLEWIGLDPSTDHIDFSRHNNPASMPKIRWLQRESVSPSPIVKKIYRIIIPLQRWRHYLRERLVSQVIERNLEPFEYPPMNATTREDLRAFFAPGNRRLAALLGRDLDHWV